jgi:hypothetical protein
MSNGGYIAQIPLKYFSEMSLDLFPGKLLRGRIISVEDGKVKIELGGAQLTAQTTRALAKGDTVTLRVVNITNKGVQFEIVDNRIPKSEITQIPASTSEKGIENEALAKIRDQITELLKNPFSQNRSAEESSLTNTLKNVLQTQDKFNFFFMVFQFETGDGKPRKFEMLVREFINEDEDADKVHELLFSTSTPRLGDIAGKVLTSGKRMRLDLTATSKSTSTELESITESLKNSLSGLGYSVSKVNITHQQTLSPLEYQIGSL